MSTDLEFDDFLSEAPTGPTGGPGPSTAATPRAVTFAELLAASTPLHWDEGVALMQELLALQTSTHRDDIPPFEDVVINSDGTLTLRSTRRGDRGPVAAGRALHALLTTADVPVALRLFVTQANAPETHLSLASFAKALAYFGKDDRTGMIRAVFARYKPSASATPPPPLPSVTETVRRPPEPTRNAEPVVSQRTLRHGLIAAASVLVVVSLVAVGWLLFSGRTQAATAENTPAETPTAAANTLAPAASPRAPAASPSRSKAAPVVETRQTSAAATPATTPKPVAIEGRATTSAPQPASTARDARGNRAASSADLALDVAQSEPIQIASLAGALLPESPSISTVITSQQAALASAIYSREDVDVQPPVMLYPQLPAPFVVGSPSESLVNSMELVVGPDGSVERVRLTAAPRRMADMMLLSGAKLWKFAPAVKDGVPVRYRTTVTWTVFP